MFSKSSSTFEVSNSQKFTDVQLSECMEIKKLLLTRNKPLVLNGVRRVNSLIQENRVVELIQSDIPRFLGDAMAIVDRTGVRLIHECLKGMSQYKEFFYNHASFVIESQIRSIQFVLEGTSCSTDAVNEFLDILATIIQGYETFSKSPERKTIEDLVGLIKGVLEKQLKDIESTYQVALLLRNVIFIHDRELAQMCLIGQNVKEEMIDKAVYCLLQYGAPFIMERHMTELCWNPDSDVFFYRGLGHVLEIPKHATEAAHTVSDIGFILRLSNSISCYSDRHDDEMHRIHMDVLTQLLLALSKDVFQFPSMWPAGWDAFSTDVLLGMSKLPRCTKHWLEALDDGASHSTAKLALLVYLFFYTLTAKRAQNIATIHTAVVSLLIRNRNLGSCILLVKTVWFLYVVSYLCKQDGVLQYHADDAKNNMIQLLLAQGDLTHAYTHHPAILYWTFSSEEIPTEIQNKVVNLWLEKRNADCKELDDLGKTNANVRHAILDIIQQGSGSALTSAVSFISTLLTGPEGSEIADILWHMLPSILDYLSIKTIQEQNVRHILDLAGTKVPNYPDMSEVVRVGDALPQVVLQLGCTAGSMSLAYHILHLTVLQEDYRVLDRYVRIPNFLLKLKDLMKMNDIKIVIPVVKIVTIMLEAERLSMSQSPNQVEFEPITLLELLQHNDRECAGAGLELTRQMLLTNFDSTTFLPNRPIDDQFKRNLFFHLMNLRCQALHDNPALYWQCMELCLRNTSEPDLATNPLLHVMIIASTEQLNHMKGFILTWLDRNQSRQNEVRRVCPSQLSKTIAHLARTILNHPSPHYLDIYNKIRHRGILLPLTDLEKLQELYSNPGLL